jgi:spoIIIJ-associated protein
MSTEVGANGSEAERLAAALQTIASACGLEADVQVTEDADGLTGEFIGDDLGPLIGHHGQTIDAIQHLVYRIVFQGSDDRRRVLVDAAGYRERRAGVLRAAADRAAESAVRAGKPVALDPMSALERRVVHEHLKARRDVETYSEGQEPARRLVVAPLVD